MAAKRAGRGGGRGRAAAKSAKKGARGRSRYGDLTPKQIDERKAQDAIKYDTAKQIREILDAARKTHGAQAWDDNDVESQVMDLVSEEA